MKNEALKYANDIERRHNMSAEIRSCGKHCDMPEAGHVGVGEVFPVRSGDGGMSGKAGRGAGKGSGSNTGPGSGEGHEMYR